MSNRHHQQYSILTNETNRQVHKNLIHDIGRVDLTPFEVEFHTEEDAKNDRLPSVA